MTVWGFPRMNSLSDLNYATLPSRLDTSRPVEDPYLLETCDGCGRIARLRFIRFTGQQFLCPICEANSSAPARSHLGRES